MRKLLILLLLLISINSYSKHVVIDIQPMGNLTFLEAERISSILEEKFYKLLNLEAEIYVLPNRPLKKEYLNNKKTRYRADKIINSFKSDTYTIILLHNDISIPYRSHNDWGILGLNLQPSKICIASDYRLSNKKDFWKIIVHEFIHSYYNYKHCPYNNVNCIMKDANGKANFSNKNSLCKKCKLNIKHMHFKNFK